MKTDAEVLEEAADLLESGRLDWVKGRLAAISSDRTQVTGVCAIGALVYLTKGEDNLLPDGIWWGIADKVEEQFDRVKDAVRGVIGPSAGPGYRSIADWNNDPERVIGDVIDAFKVAAKGLRNDE